MKVLVYLVAGLVSVGPVLAQAANVSAPKSEAPALIHAKVVVTSKYYGSFTQERNIKLNEIASFDDPRAHHSGVLYQGPCPLKPDAFGKLPVDIEDGVTVKIMPMMMAPDGRVAAEGEYKATKLVRYNKFDTGKCGEISFAESAHAWMRTTVLSRPGQETVIGTSRELSETGEDRDLKVAVVLSPVESIAE